MQLLRYITSKPIKALYAAGFVFVLVRVFIMNHCRACGVDVDNSKKNRHKLSGPMGKTICSTLTKFAANAVRTSPGHSQDLELHVHLDEEQFEAGYVCKSCYRELDKLQSLQIQIVELQKTVSEKVTKAVHHLPVLSTSETHNVDQGASQSSQQSPIVSRGRKRSATHTQSNESVKRR